MNVIRKMETTLSVLHEDNHVLGINKPAGLLSQGDSTGDESVVAAAKSYIKSAYGKPGHVYLGLVHRLDRPVSGAMVLARTSKAMQRLSAAFRDHATQKHYIALVEGRLEGSGRWEDALVNVRRTAQVVSWEHPGAKVAVLSWKALAHIGGKMRGKMREVTLAHIRLYTGRKHQIRCQFAHRGHTILGDFRYGSKQVFPGRNIALHSYCLIVPHPVKPAPVRIIAPIPKSWAYWVPKLPRELKTVGKS